jgi:hypothetical protein
MDTRHAAPAATGDEAMSELSSSLSVVVCMFLAFVTSASSSLDSPSTITPYAATLSDIALLAADPIPFDTMCTRTPVRLVLIETMELVWQRARCREFRHSLIPADGGLVGRDTLQQWLLATAAHAVVPRDSPLSRPV